MSHTAKSGSFQEHEPLLTILHSCKYSCQHSCRQKGLKKMVCREETTPGENKEKGDFTLLYYDSDDYMIHRYIPLTNTACTMRVWVACGTAAMVWDDFSRGYVQGCWWCLIGTVRVLDSPKSLCPGSGLFCKWNLQTKPTYHWLCWWSVHTHEICESM